ncbi:hypothetical protein M422DRAFT_250460 [Sphaerobolus stellatus SS14]|uniref:Uncharacterized protein n=1 Tax=Sphaerobolus stellatus (strain SS14) TaxID=990650 RepID=A0A0C9W432_SPHS4|nr:hypothetical protein M422DRAFT_250460 [Sphaerobolus stellatus SS14]
MPLKTFQIIAELLGIMIYVAGLVASKTVSACGVGTVDLGYNHGQLASPSTVGPVITHRHDSPSTNQFHRSPQSATNSIHVHSLLPQQDDNFI